MKELEKDAGVTYQEYCSKSGIDINEPFTIYGGRKPTPTNCPIHNKSSIPQEGEDESAGMERANMTPHLTSFRVVEV